MADSQPIHHHHHQLNSVKLPVETVRMDISRNILGLSTYLFILILDFMAKGRSSIESLSYFPGGRPNHSLPGTPLYQYPIMPGPNPSLW